MNFYRSFNDCLLIWQLMLLIVLWIQVIIVDKKSVTVANQFTELVLLQSVNVFRGMVGILEEKRMILTTKI